MFEPPHRSVVGGFAGGNLRLRRTHHGLERGDIFGQRDHGGMVSNQTAFEKTQPIVYKCFSAAVSGRQVRLGACQSNPSRSIESGAAVNCIFPSLAAGHTNRPRSRRFEYKGDYIR